MKKVHLYNFKQKVSCKNCDWCISGDRGVYTFCFFYDKDCLDQTGSGLSYCRQFVPRPQV